LGTPHHYRSGGLNVTAPQLACLRRLTDNGSDVLHHRCRSDVLLPLASIATEALVNATPLGAPLVSKWFAFWSVGCRLLLAGTKQTYQPAYTARKILGLKGDESLILVRELGFANVAMGVLGVLSLFEQPWQLGAALTAGVFYGLAGINHAIQLHRNRLENVAMLSDLFVSATLLGASAVVTLRI
jgi:hypothetical protein